MSSRRICIPESAERLIVPVESEFVENLKSLFGVGLFALIHRRDAMGAADPAGVGHFAP